MTGRSFAENDLHDPSVIAAPDEVRRQVLSFSDLEGWSEDDLKAALAVFAGCATHLEESPLADLSDRARGCSEARRFLQDNFVPVLIENGSRSLFTGYFEPEVAGSLRREASFVHPVYCLPERSGGGAAAPTRRQIAEGALQGQGLELFWLSDPVALYFLQVQGSGRVRLPDGRLHRIGYSGSNGHAYRSIGAELVRRGEIAADRITADAVAAWLHAHPDQREALFAINEAYVFFRVIDDLALDDGPRGTLGAPVVPGRSLAVDPGFVPLGIPVWIETGERDPGHRLMIAMDTGAAIKGAQRGDVFFGTGDAAGRRAGALKSGGRMVQLRPRAAGP